MTGKDVLQEKGLPEAATTKRFEYLPLGKELKVQTDTTKKQYQNINTTFEFDKIIKEKPGLVNYNKSNVIQRFK